MPEPLIHHVSDTAFWVATYRATESERPDALFRDPYAKILTGERGEKIAADMKSMSRYTNWSVIIRTCIIDGYINELIKDGIDTVINLGAGLDTRPYRMSLPSSLRWIEVDYPHMIEFKNERLSNEKPACRLERVPLDLADEKKRRSYFFEVGSECKKALIITEGVIPYLSQEQVRSLARDLHTHKGFQFWLTEYFTPRIYKHLKSQLRMNKMKNAPFQFFPEDWTGFFVENGWKQKSIRYLPLESERLGRKIPIPWWSYFFYIFMTKKKSELFQRMSGYVLLTKE